MPGPLGHIGELAKARATRRSSERADGQALAELETRPLGPARRPRDRMARRLRLPDQLRGPDPLRRPLLLPGPASQPAPAAPDAARSRRPRPLRPRAGRGRRRPRRPHPLRPRRRRARDRPALRLHAYGSDSLVSADGAARPRRAGGRGRALPHLRARPVRGQLHPERALEAAAGARRPLRRRRSPASTSTPSPPNAYRCGQVWGISIAVAGVRLYHQGSANLSTTRSASAASTSSSPASPAAASPSDYWRRILPRLEPRSSSPPTTTTSSARSARHGVRLQRQARRASRRDRRRQRRHRGRGAPPAPILLTLGECLAAICSIVPIVRLVHGPSSASIAFRSSRESLMPPLGSQ